MNSLLAYELKVPCTFLLKAKNLGFLDPTCGADLPEGANVSLPFWLAIPLKNRNVVQINMHTIFTDKVLDSLEAESASVNLADKNAYYFEVGLKYARITKDEHLLEVLKSAYVRRFRNIYRLSQNSEWKDSSKIKRKLTSDERRSKQPRAFSKEPNTVFPVSSVQ